MAFPSWMLGGGQGGRGADATEATLVSAHPYEAEAEVSPTGVMLLVRTLLVRPPYRCLSARCLSALVE